MKNSVNDLATIKACILGHAVGDALGLPVQFSSRDEMDFRPVEGMTGYGAFNMPAGSWSDDTSMTLCALEALSRDEFCFEDVMDNFEKWYFMGEFTPLGRSFDQGGTCSSAIYEYKKHKDINTCGQCGEHDNGNGSLMRILPFILYNGEDIPFIEKAGSLTHSHERSKMACGIYAFILNELIKKQDKSSVKEGINKACQYYSGNPQWKYYESLKDIGTRDRSEISSSGYVVATLEAAVWCLLTTESYRECILTAANLGNDTDTVAAIAGGLAGVMYGLDGIPDEWLNTIIKREYIEDICERAWDRWTKQ